MAVDLAKRSLVSHARHRYLMMPLRLQSTILCEPGRHRPRRTTYARTRWPICMLCPDSELYFLAPDALASIISWQGWGCASEKQFVGIRPAATSCATGILACWVSWPGCIDSDEIPALAISSTELPSTPKTVPALVPERRRRAVCLKYRLYAGAPATWARVQRDRATSHGVALRASRPSARRVAPARGCGRGGIDVSGQLVMPAASSTEANERRAPSSVKVGRKCDRRVTSPP